MGCNPRLFHPHLCWRVRLHGPLDSPFIPQPLLDSNRSSSLTIRRPRVGQELEDLVVKLARSNADWGYGALANLGHSISDQTVGNILNY
jgi:hypothetical protein